jgi:hypothetical protein
LAIFSAYVTAFADYPSLADRVLLVLHRLPEVVQRDFLDDRRFSVALEDYTPERGSRVWMPMPGAASEISRCVVLRPKLAGGSEDFALYVIAHEFAHAYLRNGGWGKITDVEEAADALAATWGFQRPTDTHSLSTR